MVVSQELRLERGSHTVPDTFGTKCCGGPRFADEFRDCGTVNRRLLTGAWAYGMPRKKSSLYAEERNPV